jgi:epoxyqueuosine reductase
MCVIKPEEQIKSKALALGFEGCGITSCKTFDKESRALDAWLNNLYHAGMEFMRRNREKRENPSLLHPETKSVVVVLLNYANPPISHKKNLPINLPNMLWERITM